MCLLLTVLTVSAATAPTCADALEAVESLLPEDDARVAAVQAAPKDTAAHIALAAAVLALEEPAAGNQESGTAAATATDTAVELLWFSIEALNGGATAPVDENHHAEAMNLLLDAAESWSTPGSKGAAEERATEKAVKLYERLFATTPDDPTPLFGLAALQQRAGEHAKVIATLKKALALEPNDAAAALSLALSHVALEQWEAGVAAATAAKEQHEARLAEVERLAAAGKLAAAAPGVNLQEEQAKGARGISDAMVLLGVIAVQRNDRGVEPDIAGGLASLRAALKADPGNEDAASKLAALEAAVEQHKQAQAAEKAKAERAEEARVDAADAAADAVQAADEGDASAYELDLDAEDEGVAM